MLRWILDHVPSTTDPIHGDKHHDGIWLLADALTLVRNPPKLFIRKQAEFKWITGADYWRNVTVVSNRNLECAGTQRVAFPPTELMNFQTKKKSPKNQINKSYWYQRLVETIQSIRPLLQA